VFGKNWYGTPKKWLDEALAQHKDLVLEIDVQGALQVKQKLPEAVAIFVLAPSRADIEQRIRERGQDSEDEIRRRLERSRQEILTYTKYDFAVINDDLERAGGEVQAIVLASRCRITEREGRIREILRSFGG
jgi:guanylate kinase